MISLHCLHHKLAPKYNSCSHQKLAMVGLCWMTSYVARYNTSGSIFTASVQGDQFLLLGFTATVSTFQFNEIIIIRKRMAIKKIIRNNRKGLNQTFLFTFPYKHLLKDSKSLLSIKPIQQPYSSTMTTIVTIKISQ